VLGLCAVGVRRAAVNANWCDHLTGAQEVPARTYAGAGAGDLPPVRRRDSLDYKAHARRTSTNCRPGAHPLGPAGANGPVVASSTGWSAGRRRQHTACCRRARSRREPTIGAAHGHRCRSRRRDAVAGTPTSTSTRTTASRRATQARGDFPGGEIRRISWSRTARAVVRGGLEPPRTIPPWATGTRSASRWASGSPRALLLAALLAAGVRPARRPRRLAGDRRRRRSPRQGLARPARVASRRRHRRRLRLARSPRAL
jgi:hypothetical protein